MITKKRIKVLSSGSIWALGGVSGPLNYPFKVDTVDIFRMLRDGVKVVEVLDDGREIPLTIENHDEDNSIEKEEAAPEVAPEPKAVEVTQPPLEEESPKEKKPPVQNPKQAMKNEKKNGRQEDAAPLEVEEVEKKN